MDQSPLPACSTWRTPPLPVESADEFHRWHRGRCAMCGQTPTELVEDHDHASGLVRGLLCRSCNLREASGWYLPIIRAYHAWANPAALLHHVRGYVSPWGEPAITQRSLTHAQREADGRELAEIATRALDATS